MENQSLSRLVYLFVHFDLLSPDSFSSVASSLLPVFLLTLLSAVAAPVHNSEV